MRCEVASGEVEPYNSPRGDTIIETGSHLSLCQLLATDLRMIDKASSLLACPNLVVKLKVLSCSRIAIEQTQKQRKDPVRGSSIDNLQQQCAPAATTRGQIAAHEPLHMHRRQCLTRCGSPMFFFYCFILVPRVGDKRKSLCRSPCHHPKL